MTAKQGMNIIFQKDIFSVFPGIFNELSVEINQIYEYFNEIFCYLRANVSTSH